MSAPKHTPGPWRIINSREQSKATIVGADFPRMGYVADVNLCRNNARQQADGHANAHLVKAAPAMYEALRAIIKNWERGDLAAAVRQGTAALAQAEGK